MQDQVRGIFALLCLLCAIAMSVGAWLEIVRTRRGDSLLQPRHFRLRLFSSVIWVLALLSFAGAVTIWWPPPHPTDNQKLQVYAVFTGAVSLMFIGLLLLFVDMGMLMSARRKVEHEQALRFSEELRELAEKETSRLRGEQAEKSTKVRAYAPQNGTETARFAAGNPDRSSPSGANDSHEQTFNE